VALLVAGHFAAQVGPSVEVMRNVSYVAGGTVDQRLDFYWPPGAQDSVLFVHGGSLVEIGERRTSPAYQDVCRPFVQQRIACATIDYRLAPTHKWPVMPEDVAAALVHVRSLIAARGGQPDRLVLFGHSSGCQLAAIVAADPGYLKAVGLSTAQLGGVVPMGCVLDRWDAALRRATPDQIQSRFADDAGETQRYRTAADLLGANPSFHVGAHVPPTLVIVAEDERFSPAVLEQGARFVRRLREARVPADLVVVRGTHMSSIEEIGRSDSDVFAHVLAFIKDPKAVGR